MVARTYETSAPEYGEAETAADRASVEVAHARLPLDRRWNACANAMAALDNNPDSVLAGAQAMRILRGAIRG